MSVYGSYPPPSGYDYTMPPSVVVPPPPNEVQNYQLPNVYYDSSPETMTRNYQQDLYYEDQVLVKNHVVWQPTLYRTYEYVPPRLVSQGPIRSLTEGTDPPQPVAQLGMGGAPVMANGMTNNASAAYPSQSGGLQEMLSALWSSIASLASMVQQWSMG